MPTMGWLGWPTAPSGHSRAPISCRSSSRRRSANCVVSIPAGGHAGCSTSWDGRGVGRSAGADDGLPGAGPPWPHQPEIASTAPRRLPAVGARGADGVVAAGHRRQLWLTGGTEAKVITGVDDHSRYCVIAQAMARATGRAVCLAFAGALGRFGVPRGGPDRQRQAVHRPVRPRRGGAVRSDLPRQRHRPSAHPAGLADHHRQGRAVPPEQRRSSSTTPATRAASRTTLRGS